MKIEDAKYVNEAEDLIRVTINGEITSIQKNVSSPHYRELLNQGMQIEDYEAPDISLASVESKQRELLILSDKYMLPDTPKGNASAQDILDYRAALRGVDEDLDLTGIKSLDDVNFPVNPCL